MYCSFIIIIRIMLCTPVYSPHYDMYVVIFENKKRKYSCVPPFTPIAFSPNLNVDFSSPSPLFIVPALPHTVTATIQKSWFLYQNNKILTIITWTLRFINFAN